MKALKIFSLILLILFFMAGPIWAASYQCKVYSNRKGTVDGVIVDLGTIIYTDGSGGWKTYVKWPGKFVATGLRTTWDKDNIHTDSGIIQIKFKAKLAGTRKWEIWRSKRNVITVQLINKETGEVVATKNIDERVGRPKTYTYTMDQYSPDLPDGSEINYILKISFNKKDGASGDDGTCTYEFKGIVN